MHVLGVSLLFFSKYLLFNCYFQEYYWFKIDISMHQLLEENILDRIGTELSYNYTITS